MILAELIFNSVHDAFNTVSRGEIRVEVLPRGELVECRAQDNGVAATSIQAGRGLRIVEALAKRLNGRIDHQFSPGGSA
jgi:two-component sensor histidine kinase